MYNKLILVVASYCCLNSAVSQASDNLYELSLDELINLRVTAASTFIESEHTSSSSVSVINRQDWLNRGDQNAIAALSHTTNAIRLPSPFGDVLQVRGYSTQPSSRGSATLIDNIPVNSLQYGTSAYSINNLQLGVLDRIEVVRGPGSALHGSDAFHSTIAYQTFTASHPIAEMSIEAGEEDFYQANIRLSQPLNDSISANLAIAGSQQGDQGLKQLQPGPLLGESNPYELSDHSALIKLHNKGSDNDWQFLVSLLHNHEDHPALLGSRQNTNAITLGPGNLSGQQTDSAIYKATLSKALTSDMQLSIDSYYREMDSELYLNSINGSDVFTTAIDLSERKTGLNIQLQQTIEQWQSQWTVTLGRSEHSITRLDQGTYNALTGQTISPKTDVRNTDISDQNINHLALEAKSRFFDDSLTITYGARIDDYPDFGKQVSPRLSAVYDIDANSAIKIIYGNAFRAPIIGEKTGIRHVSGDRSIEPEEIDSYELVYVRKSHHWTNEWLIYQSYLKKGISIIPDFNQTLPKTHRYANSSEQEARGIENRFNYVASNWNIKSNIAFIDSQNNTLNMPHSTYPKWISNIDIAYQLSPSTSVIFSNQLFGGHYLGDKITANGQTVEKGSAYIRCDLRITQTINARLDGWLTIKNLFDKDNRLPSVINIEGGIEDINRTLIIGGKYTF